jgi:hypothetical protein
MKFLLALALLALLACGGESTRGESTDGGGTGGGPGTGATGGTSSVDSGSGGDPGTGGAGGTSTQDAAGGASGAGGAATCGDAGLAECDTTTITCRSLPPACPAGHLPVVSGSCWAGCCVKASACRSVKDCAACSRDSYVCANDDLQPGALRKRCAEIPSACVNNRTCMCLSPTMCLPHGYFSCGQSGDGFEFSCFHL